MANKKAEILTMDGQVVSPITLATNVLLEDGRTAQDLLDSRDESMFTPTITTSSSISKVGQGDNVDFSENIIDGAYKSCVLKGKTLVNHNAEGNNRNEYACMPSLEGSNLTVNGTVESKVKSAILKGQTLVNVNHSNFIAKTNITTDYANAIPLFDTNMKASTTYTIIAYSDNLYNYRLSEMRNEREVGLGVLTVGTPFVYTTDTAFTGLRGYLKGDILNIPKGTEIKILIIEGDHTQEDIPYFEGMQSVKMPVLTTTGKNLFDSSTEIVTGQGINSSNGLPYNYPTHSRTGFLRVKPNTSYTITQSHNKTWVFAYDKNKEYIKVVKTDITSGGNFTTPNDTHYIRLDFNTVDTSEIVNGVQIEEGTVATSYEPYKTNILSTPSDLVLRGIGTGSNRVEDKLNCLTGEVTERVGEYQITGEENWHFLPGSRRLQIINPTFTPNIKCGVFACDKLQAKQGNDSSLHSTNGTYYIGYTSDNWLRIILGEDLTSLEQGKEWLKANKPTIQYQLKTESIKTVDLSDNVVYSYKDTTHYTCSSEDGSLIPTLTIEEGVRYEVIIKPSTKYSIVFNRTEVASGLTVDLGGATVNVVSTTLGKNIVQITTPPTLSHNYVIFKGLGNVIKDVQVIEGDVVGDEPYFEGMVDVKNPIVINCNSPIIFGKGGRL